MAEISRRVREIRKRLGDNQAEFAARLGVTQGTVSKWESGKQIPDVDAILQLAELGGYEVGDLVYEEDHQYRTSDWGQRASVVGTVQAGEWVEAIEWDAFQHFETQIPTPKEWPDLDLQGFVVKGASMDLVYPEGSVVFAAPVSRGRIKPGPGDRVVVQRRDANGLFEVTLKELRVDEDGRQWLWPRSSRPEFQSPIELVEPGADADAVEVTVTGVVVASFSLERGARFIRK
jgi:transcriptional regulator with XRE-family HTH domain